MTHPRISPTGVALVIGLFLAAPAPMLLAQSDEDPLLQSDEALDAEPAQEVVPATDDESEQEVASATGDDAGEFDELSNSAEMDEETKGTVHESVEGNTPGG